MIGITAVLLALTLAKAGAAPPPRAEGIGPLAASASVPTAAFAPDGSLWLAWVDGRRVYAASSKDLGKTFSTSLPVGPDGESIDANGEARPKIAVGPKGEVYVSYTRKGEQPFTGDIRFSRRLDDGSFAPPVTVNDDGLVTGHRFDTLAVAPNGDVHLVWIDKRDLEGAKVAGRAYTGAALYHAVSTDGGRSFSRNQKIKDSICECCRVAIAWDGGTPVVLWRDIFEGSIRDHALTRLDGGKEPAIQRVTDDDWRIEGCPHHGPALAVGDDGTWHLAWFTGEGKRGAGTFYRRSQTSGRTFSEPIRLGSDRAGRPAILAAGKRVWLTWKETTKGGATIVRGMPSGDGGATWAEPRALARTSGASDHPLLAARGGDPFLSWFTAVEGYRLIALE